MQIRRGRQRAGPLGANKSKIWFAFWGHFKPPYMHVIGISDNQSIYKLEEVCLCVCLSPLLKLRNGI